LTRERLAVNTLRMNIAAATTSTSVSLLRRRFDVLARLGHDVRCHAV